MALYYIYNTNNNQVINIMEWDGSDADLMAEYTSSYGYTLIEITASYDEDASASYWMYDWSGSIASSSFSYESIKYYGSFEGVFNGNVSGSLLLNGDKVETVLMANKATSYGKLKWDATSYDVVDECTPKNYFRFDREFTQGLISDWDAKKPEKISLSLANIHNNTGDALSYRHALENIVKNKLKNTNITLKNVLVPDSYKTFRINSGSIYYKQFRQNLSPLYVKMSWGEDWEIIVNEIVPDARFDELPDLDPESNDPWYEYVEFDVKEIDTSTGLSSAPLNDQEFDVYFEFNAPEIRTERYEFTSSANFTVPKWARKTTVICVGAGGGGGAGSYGWQTAENMIGNFPGDFWVQTRTNVNGYIITPYAVGGGGGAGGDVCFKTFNTYELPPLTECTVIVGAGGSGGGWYENAEYEKGPFKTQKYCSTDAEWDPQSCFYGFPAYGGHKGGDSSFYKISNPLPSDKPELLAYGGEPGRGGRGVTGGQHVGKDMPVPPLKSGGYRWNANSLKNATGLDNVGSYIVGGPGGFGISVIDPDLETAFFNMTKDRTDINLMNEYIEKFKNINNAPSLPMSSSTHFNQYGFEDAARLIKSLNISNQDNPDVLMPYGYRWSIAISRINAASTRGKFKEQVDTGMNNVASYNAPTGGGGGTGDVADSYAKIFFISKDLQNKWDTLSTTNRLILIDATDAEISSSYVNLRPKQKIGKGGKRLIKKDFYGIQFGEGGDGANLVTIGGLPEVTASNGGFPGGGGGGGASLVLTDQSAITSFGATNHHSNTFSYSSPLLPQNEGGDGYILKKESPLKGGDGANGLVVIIVEG